MLDTGKSREAAARRPRPQGARRVRHSGCPPPEPDGRNPTWAPPATRSSPSGRQRRRRAGEGPGHRVPVREGGEKAPEAAGSAHLGNRAPLVKTGCRGPSPDLDPNPARLLGCAEPHEAESAQPCSSRPRSTPTSCMGSILSYTCLDARTC
jgi:hypothetical protein